MRQAEEIQLDTPQGRRAGLRWRREGAPRVLCVHGWLDNAASFIPLARLLDELDIFAMDLPGHGYSEHRHTTARYHFIDYIWDIDAMLDALEWEQCHLLGHSLGAAVSTIFCAGAPERVKSAVLLDGLGPMSATPESSTERLRRSLAKNRRVSRGSRQYQSIEDMITARRSTSDLSENSVRLICERSSKKTGDHFEWRSDPALNWVSSLIMTDEQAQNFLQNIEAPLLTFMATPAAKWTSPEKLEARLKALAHGRHETVQGHHHFHMDNPEAIAPAIQAFILAQDQKVNNRGSNEQAEQ